MSIDWPFRIVRSCTQLMHAAFLPASHSPRSGQTSLPQVETACFCRRASSLSFLSLFFEGDRQSRRNIGFCLSDQIYLIDRGSTSCDASISAMMPNMLQRVPGESLGRTASNTLACVSTRKAQSVHKFYLLNTGAGRFEQFRGSDDDRQRLSTRDGHI
jgi:hypothetical protein